ncbi:MAG: DUF4190 domain-containing protein [Firmicutes bacterium]|nr:DUF4190 domain-containing protein [Bacillota bacterium]
MNNNNQNQGNFQPNNSGQNFQGEGQNLQQPNNQVQGQGQGQGQQFNNQNFQGQPHHNAYNQHGQHNPQYYDSDKPPPQFTQQRHRQETPGKAIAALILGILSIVSFGLLTGIPGMIIARQQNNEQPHEMATIGFWLSLVGTILSVVGILILVGYLLFLLLLAIGLSNAILF